LIEDPKMKVVEAKLGDSQEKVKKHLDNINTLPPTKRMATILAQRHSYMEFENMRDQQNILQKCLGFMQEEALKVIGELETMQGKVKKVVYETEEKHMSLTT
jgi:hypothetical protein